MLGHESNVSAIMRVSEIFPWEKFSKGRANVMISGESE